MKNDTQKRKRLFTIFPEVSWFWQSIFLYRNNSLNDYIAFFRAYLVTILKALLHCIKLRWGSLVLSIFANSWFFWLFSCSCWKKDELHLFTLLHIMDLFTRIKKKLIQFRVYLKTFCLIKIISCNKSDLIPLAAKKSRNSTDLFSVLFTDFNLVRKWALLKFGMKNCLAKSCLFDLFTYPAIIEIIDYK